MLGTMARAAYVLFVVLMIAAYEISAARTSVSEPIDQQMIVTRSI